MTTADATGGTPETGIHHRRPALVWVIFAFYILSFGLTMTALAFRAKSAVQAGLGLAAGVEYGFAFGLTIMTFTGVALLFGLHRVAVPVLATSLVLNVSSTLARASGSAVELGGRAGVETPYVAWMILGSVVWYAHHLRATGRLR